MKTSADADYRLAISQTGRGGGAGATNACAISGSVVGSRDRRARATSGGATDSRSASAANEDAGRVRFCASTESSGDTDSGTSRRWIRRTGGTGAVDRRMRHGQDSSGERALRSRVPAEEAGAVHHGSLAHYGVVESQATSVIEPGHRAMVSLRADRDR